MKILYLTYDGLSDVLGQSQVIPYLIGLSGKGHQITIVSFEKLPNRNQSYLEIESILSLSYIKWLPLKYTSFPPVLSTVYDILKLYYISQKECKINKYEIVHCRSYVTSLVGQKLKNKFQLKFIFDMRGFWADERVEGNLWNLNNPVYKMIYRFFKNKEKEYFEKADYTISLTEVGKKIIHSRKDLKNQPIPIQIIPCCVDTTLFSKQNIDPNKQIFFRTELKFEEQDFIVSYLGSIGTWYLPDEMMNFFSCLLKKYTNAKFLFITPDNKNSILTYSRKYNIPEDRISVISGSRNEVPVLLSLSNISLFFIKPVFSKSASSPTKLGEIMSLGIPVICNAGIGDTDQIVRETQTGLVVQELNEQSYFSAIEEIEQISSISPEKIRQTAINYFALEKGVEKYHEIYLKLRSTN